MASEGFPVTYTFPPAGHSVGNVPKPPHRPTTVTLDWPATCLLDSVRVQPLLGDGETAVGCMTRQPAFPTRGTLFQKTELLSSELARRVVNTIERFPDVRGAPQVANGRRHNRIAAIPDDNRYWNALSANGDYCYVIRPRLNRLDSLGAAARIFWVTIGSRRTPVCKSVASGFPSGLC